MLKWLHHNRQWLFSGLGISLAGIGVATLAHLTGKSAWSLPGWLLHLCTSGVINLATTLSLPVSAPAWAWVTLLIATGCGVAAGVVAFLRSHPSISVEELTVLRGLSGTPATVANIAGGMGINPQRALYLLEGLERRKLVYGIPSMRHPTTYHLGRGGREYLVRKHII